MNSVLKKWIEIFVLKKFRIKKNRSKINATLRNGPSYEVEGLNIGTTL